MNIDAILRAAANAIVNELDYQKRQEEKHLGYAELYTSAPATATEAYAVGRPLWKRTYWNGEPVEDQGSQGNGEEGRVYPADEPFRRAAAEADQRAPSPAATPPAAEVEALARELLQVTCCAKLLPCDTRALARHVLAREANLRGRLAIAAETADAHARQRDALQREVDRLRQEEHDCNRIRVERNAAWDQVDLMRPVVDEMIEHERAYGTYPNRSIAAWQAARAATRHYIAAATVEPFDTYRAAKAKEGKS